MMTEQEKQIFQKREDEELINNPNRNREIFLGKDKDGMSVYSAQGIAPDIFTCNFKVFISPKNCLNKN